MAVINDEDTVEVTLLMPLGEWLAIRDAVWIEDKHVHKVEQFHDRTPLPEQHKFWPEKGKTYY